MKAPVISEQQLVEGLKAKQSPAFTHLYDAYAPALFGIILRIVKDRPLAEDLLHDAFLKIWANIASFDAGRGRLFTWLVTLARRVAIDALRDRQHQQRADSYLTSHDDIADPISLPEATSSLNLLKPIHRQVLELVYYGDHSQPEIAKKLNLPLGTVKTRIRTGLQQLKALLERDVRHYQLG